jgi:hypothetical protein
MVKIRVRPDGGLIKWENFRRTGLRWIRIRRDKIGQTRKY